MKRKKGHFIRKFILIVALVWGLVFVYSRYVKKKSTEQSHQARTQNTRPQKPRTLVKVMHAKREEDYRRLSLVGQIEGLTQVNVYPDVQITGIVLTRFVQEGARVRAGQALMRIDQRSTTGYQFKHFTVRSKIPGVVLQLYPEEGELITASTKLATIAQIDSVKLILDIPQSNIASIRENQSVEIQATNIYPNEVFKAKISQVYPSVNPITLTLKVEVLVPNPDHKLKPGMFVKAEVFLEKIEAVFIPLDALLIEDNMRYVYIYDPTTKEVRKRIILTGDTYKNTIQVKSGIDEGEAIVVEGNYQVWDREQVNISILEPNK